MVRLKPQIVHLPKRNYIVILDSNLLLQFYNRKLNMRICKRGTPKYLPKSSVILKPQHVTNLCLGIRVNILIEENPNLIHVYLLAETSAK